MQKIFRKVSQKHAARKVIRSRIGVKDVREKQGILYPRAKIVVGLGALLLVLLAFVPLIFQSPSMIQVGINSLFDVFSITVDSDQGGENLAMQGEVSWQGSFSNELPDEFDTEIGLSGDSATVVSNNGRTIGFTCTASVQETMADIREELEQKGWTYVPSGQESSVTFAKDEGVYCWLVVTCVSVDESTSVVLVPGRA